jgi:cobalt-zinc-cadmium efflux system outer membrane protein
MLRLSAAIIAALLCCPPAGRAQQLTLTLDQALAVARERAPALQMAATEVDEARARLQRASLWLQDNPVVDASAGRRFTGGRDFTEADIRVGQELQAWGRRAARIDIANADLSAATAERAVVAGQSLQAVATAFLEALASDRRLQLAQRTESLAADVAHSTQRRHEAGDLPILEVNLARVAAVHAKTEVLAAEAEYLRRLALLRGMLDLEPAQTVVLQGPLFAPRDYDLEYLLAAVTERPDMQLLAAELRRASAEVELGQTFQRPDVGIGAVYARDEGDNVVLGGLRFTLPVFARGDEMRAIGLARAQRARIAAEATRRAREGEVRAAFEAYRRQREAVTRFEQEALDALEENETLARRSYEVGQISLAELLLVRRQALDAQRAHLDRQLAAALAAVDLESSSGVLR